VVHAEVAGDLPAFLVVGIGASAGGLEALSQLLGTLPNNAGMAYVVVQHLAAKHESMLPELLGGGDGPAGRAGHRGNPDRDGTSLRGAA